MSKIKPIIAEGVTDIVHPSGDLSKTITRKDLEKYPERYVKVYPHCYVNSKHILHAVNSRVASKSAGTKVQAIQQKIKGGSIGTFFKGKSIGTIRRK